MMKKIIRHSFSLLSLMAMATGAWAQCASPSGIGATGVTSSSADINWTGGGGASQSEIEIVLSGSSPTGMGTMVTGTTYNATGLLPGTSYDVYVRDLCPAASDMIITGVFDGPLTGGTPKFVELYVINDIADMSIYGVSSANNGTGSTAPNPEYNFPAISASAGDHITIAADSANFFAYFGFYPTFVHGTMPNVNGDDAMELFKDTVVVDVYGVQSVDGTGQAWEYLDGWAYRNNGSDVNNNVFALGGWTLSGLNATDGCTGNSSCSSVYPMGTFTTPSDQSAWVGPFTFTTPCASTVGDSLANPFMVMDTVYMDSGNTASCFGSELGNAAADVFYQVQLDGCADSISVHLCSMYDGFLRLLDANGNELANDDNGGMAMCGPLSTAYIGYDVSGMSTVYVVVEGAGSDEGTYNLIIMQSILSPVATFDYPNGANYCVANANPQTPNITGTSGGVFSIMPSNDLDLDTVTGVFFPQMDGDYTITYSVGSGVCFGSYSYDVHIGLAYAADFDYAADSFCVGSLLSVVPGNMVQQGGVFSSSAGLSIGTDGTINLIASTPGAYTVQHIIDAPCPDTATFDVTVVELDDASFSYSATAICEDTAIIAAPDITITGVTGGTFSALNGILVVDANTGEIQYPLTDFGTETIVYTTNGFCPTSDSFDIQVSVCGAVTTLPNAAQFSVFPNPNNGNFAIQNLDKDGVLNIRIVDVLGKEVYTENNIFVAKGALHTLQLSGLANGTYTALIANEQLTASYKVVVVK